MLPERSRTGSAPWVSGQHGYLDAYADVIADLQVTVSTKVAQR
jgi:hypothetical protein